MRLLKSQNILRLANSYFIDSPQPANISYLWNFGSLLGLCLILQILTGVFLAMHYAPNVDLAFNSVEHIMRDVNSGWLIRYTHANVASFFFIFVFAHIGRALYYGSYKSPRVLPYSIGVIILVLMMGTAFLGYVLPYGQMSFWGLNLSPICIFNISLLESFLSWSDTNVFTFIPIIHTKGNQVNRIKAEYRIGPHNLEILSIIYGTLLGDSHAEHRINGKGTRISFYQEANHAEYLLWLHSKFASQGYCNPVVPKIITRLSTGGKIRNTIRFHTFTYSSFNYIHEDWYLNGIKFVPHNIETYLTPLALAVWIMDDGSRAGSGLKLSTNSFTFEDTTRLVLNLNKLYGIKSSVQNAGHLNQYIIYIWSESMLKIRQLVKPYMVSSMLYKLGDISMKDV